MATEKLSLSTFDAAHALEPFLNSPRSLEACRMHGINPIELVEVPMEEFRRDCPDDPDTAQRRYDKIDGARRRLLKEVTADWKKLCEENWEPGKQRGSTASSKKFKESIIPVDEQSHTTLLDIQAERFRKVEQKQWQELQRLISTEIRNAVIEAQNQAITNKHGSIQANNDRLKRERQLAREQAYKDRCDFLKRQEEEREAENRRLQREEAHAAQLKKIETEKRLKAERYAREQRELERVQREEYTRTLKTRIFGALEAKAEEQNKIFEERTKETQARIAHEKEMKRQQLIEKQRQIEAKVKQAMADQQAMADAKISKTNEKLEKEDQRLRELQEMREIQHKMDIAKNAETTERLNKIKQSMVESTNKKIERTVEHIQYKELTSKQEKERLDAEMERRKRLKAIRQEAFEISSLRQKKAEEYRKKQIADALAAKESKCNAIAEGQQTLKLMSGMIKDVMGRARSAIREGVKKLQSEDNFSLERVKELTESITNEVLIPMLSRSFGNVPIAQNGTVTGELPPIERSRSLNNTMNSTNSELPSMSNDEMIGLRSESNVPAGRGRAKTAKKGVTLPLQPLNLDELNKSMTLAEENTWASYRELHASKDTSPSKSRSISPSNSRKKIHSAGGTVNRTISQSRTLDSHVSFQDDEMDYDDGEDLNVQVVRQNGDETPPPKKQQRQPDFKSAVVFGTDSHTEAHTEDMLHSFANSDIQVEDWDGTGNSDDYQNNSSRNKNSTPRSKKKANQIHHDSNPNMAQAARDEVKKQFRAEFSSDHPFAGGSGKYKKEKKAGLKPVLGQPSSKPNSKSKNKRSNGNANDIVVFKSTKQHPDSAPSMMKNPQQYLDQLRKEQNEYLLKLLEQERFQEDERINALKLVAGKEVDERNRLELVFAEERRRASERIINTTRMHEKKLKEAVIAVELGRNAASSLH